MKNFIKFFLICVVTFIITFTFYRGPSRIDLFAKSNLDHATKILSTSGATYWEPDWCVSQNERCTQIEKDIPLFYQNNFIKLKALEDAELRIFVKGIYKLDKNDQLIPIKNTYQQFKVNGQKVASKEQLKDLWHDNPYVYTINVHNGDIVTLEYKNRFLPRMEDCLKFGIIWFLLSVLGIFAYLKFPTQKFKSFLEKDWLAEIGLFYKGINPVYRRSFWIVFIISNIVFGFHTVHFLWGNNDWVHLKNGAAYLTYALIEGLYGAWTISELLTGNLYLPFISSLWGLAALSLSGIFLAIYWKVPKKTAYFVIFCLILNITPYTLSWVWYSHLAVNNFFARLLTFAGFVLADKISSTHNLKAKCFISLLVIFLLHFSLAIYQPMAETFMIVLAGRFIVEMLASTSLKTSIKKSLSNNWLSIFYAICAIATYELVFLYLKHKNMLQEGRYNLGTTPFSEIPSKALSLINAAWQQFTNFSISFYPDVLTKLFLILACLFLIQVLSDRKKTWPIKLEIGISFFMTLFLTKTVALLANYDMTYSARIDFCGYVLFNALIAALCLNIGGIIQNIKILLMCVIIYIFACQDLYQQRTWKIGFEAEQMLWNRIMERIETHPHFDSARKYFVLQIGDPIAMRRNFYPEITKVEDEDLLTSSTDSWEPSYGVRLFNKDFTKKYFFVNEFTNKEFMSTLKRLDDAGLLKNANAWPEQNSIIIHEDIILFITDKAYLEKAKQLLAEQNQTDSKEKK